MKSRNSHKRESLLLLFMTCAFVLVGVSGCGKKQTQGRAKELVVLCGSSFVNATEQLCS